MINPFVSIYSAMVSWLPQTTKGLLRTYSQDVTVGIMAAVDIIESEGLVVHRSSPDGTTKEEQLTLSTLTFLLTYLSWGGLLLVTIAGGDTYTTEGGEKYTAVKPKESSNV